MAKQRQTNVNINYTVTTADLERGNALLVRAQKATDDLRKSSDTYARTASAQNKTVSSSIAGMQIQLQRLRTQIENTSRSDTKRLAQLSGQYKAIKAQVDSYNKALFQTNTATKQVTASAGGMASQFNQVYNAVRLIVTAGLARELVQTALSAAMLTGKIEGVERAFFRAFPQGELLLNELRRSTHGAVTDLELMQRAIQASNFGISVRELGTLFEFAAVRAQQTGESVDYLVNSIVTGIGRKSILVLDNLGISATRLKEHFDEASIASQSVGEVTRVVAGIAREELDKMGGFAETSATKVSQLNVEFDNLRTTLSQKLTSSWFLDFLSAMTRGATDLIKAFPADKFAKIFEVQSMVPIVMMRRLSDVFAYWHVNLDKIAEKEQVIRLATEEVTRVQKRMVDIDTRDKLTLIDEEISKRNKVLDNYFYELQALEMVNEKHSERGIAVRLAMEEIEETNRLLKVFKKEQEDILNKTVEAEARGPQGRPPRMTQVVDLRYRDPDTGYISKERNDKILRDFINNGIELIGAMPPAEIRVTPIVLLSDWERAWDNNKQSIIEGASSIIQEQVDSFLFAELQSYDARIDALRKFYDEQIELAGDNERAKQELRIKEEREIAKLEAKRADREKKAVLASIRTNTALAIIKVWAGEGTWVDKLIRAGLVAAIGASQYVAANRERYYAKGDIDIKGPGTETSDSIPAWLSRGESVMTARETKASRGILKAIRAKKLSDKVMDDIISGRSGGTAVGSFDDRRLLKKLDEVKNAQPDIIERAGMIYEVRRKGDNYRQIVRSKSMIR